MAETYHEEVDPRKVRFETYDTCVLRKDPSMIGIVLRTYHDLQTHEPIQDCLIIAHTHIDTPIWSRFASSGIPPKGCVFVDWAREQCGYSLVLEDDLRLLNRSLGIGDHVTRLGNDSMIGTVVSVKENYTLEPICLLVESPEQPHYRLCDVDGPAKHDSRLPEGIQHCRPQKLLYEIPGDELKKAEDYEAGDHVISHHWLGIIGDCDVDVVLLLDDESVVMVECSWELELIIPHFSKPIIALPDYDDIRRPGMLDYHTTGVMTITSEELLRGQYVVTNERNIRNGRWIRGAYRPDKKPQGRILDIRTRRLDVEWLCPNAFAPRQCQFPPPSSIRPYENLSSFRNPRDLRRRRDFVSYDRCSGERKISESRSASGMTLTSPHPNSSFPVPKYPSIIHTGQGFRVGHHVKFRNQAGAAVKYNGQGGCSPEKQTGSPTPDHLRRFTGDSDDAFAASPRGHFDLIPRELTYNFDLNEFKIVTSKTEVIVQWQDQTRTTERSTQLEPFSLPEAELCPGDLVTAKQGMRQVLRANPESGPIDFSEMLYFQDDYRLLPQQVGVVQSVNAKERLALVRWFEEPRMVLTDHGHVLDPHSRLGPISDVTEEVSLYEIMSHPAFVHQRGDIVMIPPRKPTEEFPSRWMLDEPMYPFGGPSVLSQCLRGKTCEEMIHVVRDRARFLINYGLQSTQFVDDNHRPLDWIGEIVGIGLDGMRTVRVAEQSCDIEVPVEHILMVIDEDAAFDDGQSMASERSAWVENPGHNIEAWESGSESAIDEEVEYEGGERIDNDSGDEMWMTDEESPEAKELKDNDMPDAEIHPQLPEDTRTAEHDVSHIKQSVLVKEGPNVSSLNRPAESTLSPQEVEPTHGPHQPARYSLSLNPPSSTAAPPPPFQILETSPPSDQFHLDHPLPATSSSAFLHRVMREHRILSTSLPLSQIYVRTYEERLDLLRCLIIGPANTPYEYAPLVVDLHLGPEFPAKPPIAHFHSWTGGLGRINPNLYEEGKICLSLLGTWAAKDSSENWNANASILQILVSLMGLVLVKEPFYNEAGFEQYGKDQAYKTDSQRYSEKVYVMARGFVKHALQDVVPGIDNVLAYLYLSPNGLLEKVIDRANALMSRSSLMAGTDADGALLDGAGETGDSTMTFLKPLSRGAIIMLKRHIAALETIAKVVQASRAEPGSRGA